MLKDSSRSEPHKSMTLSDSAGKINYFIHGTMGKGST